MISRISKTISLPSKIFYADNYGSIKSILGNDIFIEKYTKNDILLPNNYVLINVEYQQIDFSSFEIYQVSNPKKMNLNSNKYVVEIKNGDKKYYVKVMKPNENKFWIKLYACRVEEPLFEEKNEMFSPLSIHYFGLQIKNPREILHNFCTLFGNEIFTYHGTKLTYNYNKCFNFYENKIPNELVSVDAKKETEAFKNINAIKKGEVNSYYNTSWFKKFDLINVLPTIEVKDKEDYKQIIKEGVYIIKFNQLTPSDLEELLLKLKYGFVVLTNERSLFSLLYFNTKDYVLTKNMIEMTLTTIVLDYLNILKFYEIEDIK